MQSVTVGEIWIFIEWYSTGIARLQTDCALDVLSTWDSWINVRMYSQHVLYCFKKRPKNESFLPSVSFGLKRSGSFYFANTRMKLSDSESNAVFCSALCCAWWIPWCVTFGSLAQKPCKQSPSFLHHGVRNFKTKISLRFACLSDAHVVHQADSRPTVPWVHGVHQADSDSRPTVPRMNSALSITNRF